MRGFLSFLDPRQPELYTIFMQTQAKKTEKGFTVAQLLLSLAVLAVLALIFTPVIMRELERGLESADFAEVRTVYAEFMTDIIEGDEAAKINDIPIKQVDGTYRAAIYPLNQRMDGWTLRIDNKKIGGIPSEDWIGQPRKYGACILSYYPHANRVSIYWGTAFPLMTLDQLYRIDNTVRIGEDQRLLRELGEEILRQYWSPKELRRTLAMPEDHAKAGKTEENTQKGKSAGSGPIRIADFYQLKKDMNTPDGFRILSAGGPVLEKLLRASGYETGSKLSSKTLGDKDGEKKGQTLIRATYQYSLFFSNQMAANRYEGYSAKAAGRSIYVDEIRSENGVITGLTIYVKAIDDQAPLTKKEEKKFRIEVK